MLGCSKRALVLFGVKRFRTSFFQDLRDRPVSSDRCEFRSFGSFNKSCRRKETVFGYGDRCRLSVCLSPPPNSPKQIAVCSLLKFWWRSWKARFNSSTICCSYTRNCFPAVGACSARSDRRGTVFAGESMRQCPCFPNSRTLERPARSHIRHNDCTKIARDRRQYTSILVR